MTVVAATSILGDQFVLFGANRQVAAALWIASLALWIGFVYAFFVAMTIRRVKPPLAMGLDGTWLLTVVATRGDRDLRHTCIRRIFSARHRGLRPLCLFLLGGFLYLILISLIVQRWLFAPMQPEQLTPSYWINMGGAAITTLARSDLASVVGGGRSANSGAHPLDRGDDGVVLGDRDLVGSTARDASGLASYRAPDPSIISIGILVHGVSARYVHGGDLGFVASKRRAISRGDTASLCLDRIDLLASRLCRNDAASVAPAWRRPKELQTC